MVVFDLHTPVWLSHVTHLVWLGWVWSDLLGLNQGVSELNLWGRGLATIHPQLLLGICD